MTCSAKMCPSSCELLLRFVKDNVVARWAKIGCGFKVDTFLPLPKGVSRSYFFSSPLSHFLQEVCKFLVKSVAFIKPVWSLYWHWNLYSKLLYSIPIKWNILEHALVCCAYQKGFLCYELDLPQIFGCIGAGRTGNRVTRFCVWLVIGVELKYMHMLLSF